MIKRGDIVNVQIDHRTGNLIRPAKCIKIYKKDKYNMCLLETEKGIRTCINDYAIKQTRKAK